jgi:microcystin degradation protein MlrC
MQGETDMAHIAVGGFQHETNTFSPTKATFEEFEKPDAWPGLCRGEGMLASVDGVHIPVTGALDTLREAGADIVPLCWSAATPSAHVTEDAFERVSAMLLEDLKAAGRLDGIYLDLHGAMVCDHFEDGEGELLRRIRALVGAELPIAVSLDLHANLTEAMVRHADVLDIYRTYPHIDMGETGARAAEHLLAMVSSGGRWAKAFRRTDFLIPLNFGCTDVDPPKGLYGETLTGLLNGDRKTTALALAMGFPLSDIAEVGPGLVAYGADQAAADRAADALIDATNAREAAFGERILSPVEAVAEAKRLLAEPGHGPVVIADTQDNPGGGGPGDTTGMLRALLDGGAGAVPGGAVIGVFRDPDSAETIHRHPVGSAVDLDLGGKLFPGDAPLSGRYEIRAVGNGEFTGTGPMWGGARYRMGPYALVRRDGVDIVVASKAEQAGDQSMFRHVGVEPSEVGILVLKSSVHFRADFAPLARAVLVAAAPGPVYADPGSLPFKRTRSGLRLRPGLGGSHV